MKTEEVYIVLSKEQINYINKYVKLIGKWDMRAMIDAKTRLLEVMTQYNNYIKKYISSRSNHYFLNGINCLILRNYHHIFMTHTQANT